MSKDVKSARGALVNFDLLRIKQQIATAPKPAVVKAREDFIDQKFKRRIKKLTRNPTASIVEQPEVIDDPEFDVQEESE